MAGSVRSTVRASLLALATAACATAPAEPGPVTGQWGGAHVALELGGGGGRADYDCAAGTIDEPLARDDAGRFAARGTHTPGQGGPERAGHVPPSYPARYSGVVRGEAMTLRVDVPALNVVIGPYTLRRGAEAMLMRCL